MVDHEEEDRKRIRLLATFMTIPFILAVPPIIGWFIGSWLDKQWGTAPLLMYILIVLGIVAGVREFYRIIRKYGDNG